LKWIPARESDQVSRRERAQPTQADDGGVVAARNGEADLAMSSTDCSFAAIDDPAALAVALSAIPGMLGHGLFLDEIDAAYVGTDDGVIQLSRDGS
jgi:ribose 5-phosphate isomerase